MVLTAGATSTPRSRPRAFSMLWSDELDAIPEWPTIKVGGFWVNMGSNMKQYEYGILWEITEYDGI